MKVVRFKELLACCYACQPGRLRPACRYLNALQTNAQHLLRYLAAAVVVNKRRRNVLKELIRVVEQQVPSVPVLGVSANIAVPSVCASFAAASMVLGLVERLCPAVIVAWAPVWCISRLHM